MARSVGFAIAALTAGSAAVAAPPPVEAITWIVSNTMAVPDGERMRRPADELVQWLQAQLPQVVFKPVVANAERSWALIRKRQQACHGGAARTPERERLAYFTNTWLVPHQERLPEWISGQHDTVALRVSDHPLVRALCRHTGPLVSTSANPAGRPAARSRLRVEQYFPRQLDKVLGGALGGRKNPSLIRDLRTGDVIRPS